MSANAPQPSRPEARRRPMLAAAAAALALALVAAACGDDADSTDEEAAATTTTTVLEQPLSDCFWSEPINREQSNSQFPDAGATYWFASIVVPDGAVVRLAGEYPHARYASFMVYGVDPVNGNAGTPFDGLADVETAPDDGSANPFAVGADRAAADRSYDVELVGAAVPTDDTTREPNTLYGVPTGESAGGDRAQELIYRVYVPDEGRNLLGDTGLPEMELELADGSVQSGEQACETLQSDPVLDTDALPSLTEERYAELRAISDEPTHPAQTPVAFRRFFNAGHATFSTFYTGTEREPELAAVDASPFGGYYSNLDNNYVLTVVDRELGEDPTGANVVVVTGVAPSTPTAAAETMPETDLRYWSICQNESSVTTRVADCLYDEQVPQDANGNYTIVISRPEDRPENATSECGVAWLDWGPGDGVDRPEYGLVIVRHMLPSAEFEETIANVSEPGDEETVMGSVLPQATYQTPAEFEGRGCASD
jgi:hypothetical protein